MLLGGSIALMYLEAVSIHKNYVRQEKLFSKGDDSLFARTYGDS